MNLFMSEKFKSSDNLSYYWNVKIWVTLVISEKVKICEDLSYQ